MGDPRARDSGNTLLHKRFPGGHITVAGANSPASLASRPIRVVLCDEVASGTLEVRVGDKSVRYQTMAELIKARDLIRDQLSTASSGSKSRASFASFVKD